MKKIDPRIVIAVGFALFAGSNFFNVFMTNDYAADQLMLPNIIRAVGQALCFAPLSAVANAGIEHENAGSASALFNMMRNLGGAIGIALLQTFLTKREQFHSNMLNEPVSALDPATRSRLDGLTGYFLGHGVTDPAAAAHKALVAIGAVIKKQAFIMAFSDTFFLLGGALILALAASLLLKKPSGPAAAGGAH